MNTLDFVKFRNDLVEEKKKMEQEIDKRYNDKADEFIEANSVAKWGDVYEFADSNVKTANKPNKSKRFVVYTQDIRWMNNNPIIICGVWWLNEKTNVPQKWDTITTFGATGIPEIIRSENQVNLEHPDAEPEQ